MPIFTSGIAANDFDAANVSGEERLHCHHASSKGSTRNSAAPLTRCMIETTAGTGIRICSRLRYLGRVAMCSLSGLEFFFTPRRNRMRLRQGLATLYCREH